MRFQKLWGKIEEKLKINKFKQHRELVIPRNWGEVEVGGVCGGNIDEDGGFGEERER